jgi:hypothetical protein
LRYPSETGVVAAIAFRWADDQEPEQELSEKADEERRKCRDWLLKFMRADQPKFLTKAELREAAMRELKVSKNSFDFGWISAIEETRALPLA